MLLDLSQKPDLRPLADLVRALQGVATPAGVELFLMGAAARDVLLRHAHNIEQQRITEDVDIAVRPQAAEPAYYEHFRCTE